MSYCQLFDLVAYTTIRIEGNILAPDVLKRMQAGDIHGQQPADFGLKNPLREEIQFQYGQARRQWETFQSFLNHREVSETGTSETRRLWILPLLQFLGYEVERGASPSTSWGCGMSSPASANRAAPAFRPTPWCRNTST